VLKIGLEPKLIKGFHEYKVSRFTEVEYVDRPFDPYSGHRKRLLQWSKDIFPEPDVNTFMWMHAATGLDFCESACILLLLVGGGQNGKTSWAKMVHNTLGNQYCAVGKSSLLTSPFERGENANSAQMQMRDKRWFYFDEFNKSEEINVARMKSLVNPNWQSGRDLREKQTIFRNTCNPVAFSNYDFTFPANTNDHGTWRRIYYYRNKAKFSKRPNKENPYEKLADDNWITTYPNDPSFKTAMLECMVYHYQIYCREYDRDLKKIPVPTIMRETEDFRNRQDTVNRFITQMIVKSPNGDPLSLTTLSTKYCEWYNRNVKMVAHSSTEVQSAIENSRLSSSFEFTNSGVKLLFRHRIKLTAEEPLMPGEEELIQIKQSDGETIGMSVGEDGFTNSDLVTVKDQEGHVRQVPGVLTHQGLKLGVAPDPAAETENQYIKDLIRNAPAHLQKSAVPTPVNLEKIIGDALNI
jgi:phage/plasmid-associated DNA primase